MSNMAGGIPIGFGAGFATGIAAGMSSGERKARQEIADKIIEYSDKNGIKIHNRRGDKISIDKLFARVKILQLIIHTVHSLEYAFPGGKLLPDGDLAVRLNHQELAAGNERHYQCYGYNNLSSHGLKVCIEPNGKGSHFRINLCHLGYPVPALFRLV